jgi:excisionase family DNA binding protein
MEIDTSALNLGDLWKREELMTVAEVAKILRVTEATILRWVQRGQLGAVRLDGGGLRFIPAVFVGWVKARELATQHDIDEMYKLFSTDNDSANPTDDR